MGNDALALVIVMTETAELSQKMDSCGYTNYRFNYSHITSQRRRGTHKVNAIFTSLRSATKEYTISGHNKPYLGNEIVSYYVKTVFWLMSGDRDTPSQFYLVS